MHDRITGYLQTLTSVSAPVSIRGIVFLFSSSGNYTNKRRKPQVRFAECWARSYRLLRWTEMPSLHMLPKPLVWQRRSLSYWQSFPQSPIQSLFSGCVQRRVKEFKFYFIPPITPTSPISHVNDCTWRHNKKYLLVTINWGRNVSTVPGGLLCENLLSSTTAAIFFSQLVTISLIANAAEYCHQALVQSCQLLGAHAPLPAVNHFTEKSINCLLYWIQVLTFPH